MIKASWQLSAATSLALALLWALAAWRLRVAAAPSELAAADLPGAATTGRGRHRTWVAMTFAREFAVLMGVFAVYQHTAYLVYGHYQGAFEHALLVWRAERWLHLPSEVAVQHLTAGWPAVEEGMNWYYANMHLTAMAVFVLWMWWRHRDHYPLLRNTIAATTVISVLIQLVPVAPPRMFPQLGFVDTAEKYGQSVYGYIAFADQLAAMPSIHVAWAVIIAVFGVRVARRRWWPVFIGHAVIVTWVVVATANHWWLDAVGGILVLSVVLAVLVPLHRRLAARREVRLARPAAAAELLP